MSYEVKLTKSAIGQLNEAIWYISKVLIEPETAKSWSDRIKKDISSLNQLPHRYPLVAEEPWRTEGIRKMTVENFIIYYWVNDDDFTVWITAAVYGRRDQLNVLRNITKE